MAGLAAGVLVGIVGAWTILITPGLLAVLAAQVPLSDQQLGYVAAWDINAMALTIGISTFLLPRWDWRLCVAAGLSLIFLGNVATAFSASYGAVAAARAIAGMGEGIAVGFAFAAFGRAANPDRAFAIYLVTGALSGALALLYLPTLQERFGTQALFMVNGAFALIAAAGLRWFPHGRVAADDPRATAQVKKRLAVLSLLGVFFYFGAISAMWSYAERIGQSSGLDADQIARGLAFGTFAGMAGAALAGLTPRRFGRVWPLAMSGAVSVISFRMLDGHLAPTIFIVAMILLLFAWNYAQPLLSGVCSDADPKGRVVCAMGSIQTFGMGFGPAAVALTLGSGSFSIAIWGSCAVLAASLLIVIAGIRTSS
ncbi:MFS transporter [Sphingobium cloacae]|uniref:MFS transporter n=2 Tax=Sphingobium cloacae TaxID=120107 RepID=A0A1E1F1Q1_9SPHN|nr:MFS transporter [Sphingobium cloacae]BAV64447.1 MFS transporter [Sphingobium cloacae]